MIATASIKKPIHNVKERRNAPHITDLSRQTAVFISREFAAASRNIATQFGGAYRDRTDDLMLAKQPLSQLS
jgi:hypothetical protein